MNKYSGFQFNQYEELGMTKFEYGEVVEARYIRQSEITYQNNPLIEALPPMYTEEQIYQLIERGISFSEDERQKDDNYRFGAISRLKDSRFCMDGYIDIARKIDMMMKGGYSNKRFPDPATLCSAYRKADESNGCNKNGIDKFSRFEVNSTKPSMAGFTLFGISGGGKSLAVNSILSFYPQLIIHNMYKGEPVVIKQIPYLKIDCTYDGSIKGLYRKFFDKIDEIVGTNYTKKTARLTVYDLAIEMRKVVARHAIGCIIIDEIQHLANARNGSQLVMNALVTMANELNLPILFIGTYKAAQDLLMSALLIARRASGIGEIEWERMKNDEDFEIFLKHIWKYQWVRKPSKLTKTIVDKFYNCTMGITDRVVKLFMLCQMEAIYTGLEHIDERVIGGVAKCMPLTDRIIRALRDDDYKTLSEYDDVLCPNIDQTIEHKREMIENREAINRIRLSDKEKKRQEKNDIFNELLVFACQFDVGELRARKIVNSVLNNGIEKKQSKSGIRMQIADIIVNGKSLPKKKKKIVPEIEPFETVDLREEPY
jgi:hypothetical protein